MNSKRGKLTAITLLIVLALLTSYYAFADPGGATLSNANTEQRANATPGSRADARSTITTMDINAIQKDQQWKAYVGNVTGSLTLDDASNYTIYDWALSTITGEVYAARYDNITWSGVQCAAQAQINTESVFHNMSNTESDRLNATFNYTTHQSFQVGEDTINADSCNSTFLYVNDTVQAASNTADWQEVLLRDANDYMLFTSIINDDTQGYNNNGTGSARLFDFQMIVPESDLKGTPTTYYFYVELG